MNKHFEPIVLETYAELCVRWRMAHIENRVQAADYDAQLKSLEAVIQSFNLNFPGSGKSTASGSKAKSAPAAPSKEAAPPARSGSVILED